jgi:hypothetical protein
LIEHSDASTNIILDNKDSTGAWSRALVTMQKRPQGALAIGLNDTYARLATDEFRARFNQVLKPLNELWWEAVLILRSGDGTWEPVSVTPALVRSSSLLDGSASGPRIVRIEPHGRAVDTSFTDFSAFVPLSRLPAFVEGEPLSMAVETGAPDDIVVCSFGTKDPVRLSLSTGNRYEGVLPVPPSPLRTHLVVYVLARSTIYDGPMYTTAYSAEAVLLPGEVSPRPVK